jgi:hypothetical protein
MLPSFSPYAPQGLMPQSFVGSPLFSPGLPGPQGAYGMNAPFGHDYPAQSPYAFGAAQNPFSAYQYLQNPQLVQNPQFAYGQQLHGSPIHNPFLNSGSPSGYAGGHIPAQLVPVLAQLAQQISVQSAVIQQLGITLQQLAQQLTGQILQSPSGATLGAGQGFGAALSPFGGIAQASAPGGLFSAQNPFAGAAPVGYVGFNPQPQGWWGGNRSQTIQ